MVTCGQNQCISRLDAMWLELVELFHGWTAIPPTFTGLPYISPPVYNKLIANWNKKREEFVLAEEKKGND